MSDELDQAAPAPADAVQEAFARKLAALEADMAARVLRAEMKVHALRAGMVDLDGLKLLDMGGLVLDERGEVAGGAAAMAALRRAKPWLFGAGDAGGGASTSSLAAAPPPQAPRAKLATEMGEAEWQAARAELLRRG
jgi:hypothetical protein